MRSLYVVCVLLSLPTSLIANANAEKQPIPYVACKKSDGSFAIRAKRCNRSRGETQVTNISQLNVRGPGEAIAFASVRADGVKRSCGGALTTSCSLELIESGSFRATFTGNFVGLTAGESFDNRNRLTVLATADVGVFRVANAQVRSASLTTIEVDFFTWNPGATTHDDGAHIAVYLGDL